MRCPYCEGQVVGDQNAVILVGSGPAHTKCYERHIISKRIYKNIHFSSMTAADLVEMKEMILIELNARERPTGSSFESEDDIELFA